MADFESLIVAGSSGTGKTTAVSGLRTVEFAEKLVIPLRFMTRPWRTNDDEQESRHIDEDNYQSAVAWGVINPYWRRAYDIGHIVHYGFRSLAPEEERLRVYSANNAFLREDRRRNPSISPVLASGLVVILEADTQKRDERLLERSPDMPASERHARIADAGNDLLSLAGAKDVEYIDTTNFSDVDCQQALQEIVRKIL